MSSGYPTFGQMYSSQHASAYSTCITVQVIGNIVIGIAHVVLDFHYKKGGMRYEDGVQLE